MSEAFTLTRLSSGEDGTFGILTDAEHNQICVTLELPWRDNEHDQSCVPAGTYQMHRRYSPKHRCEVFELEDVPGRGNIELHVGNFIHDSLGCVLLGSAFASFDGEKGVSGSRKAFERFMERMRGIDTATLTITNPT